MRQDCIFCSCSHRDRAYADQAVQADHAGGGLEPLEVVAARLNVSVEQLNRHKICLGLVEAPAEGRGEYDS